jgi:glycosyltransferase involved in cell wall biosynthesis
MIIWYLNHYAAPPKMGFSGRCQHLGQFFKSRGSTFINICASFHHLLDQRISADYTGRINVFDGVPYFHVLTRAYSGNNAFRLINMLEYTLRVARLDRKINDGILARPDVVIASCAHIFSYLAACRLRRKLRLKVIYEARDLWPLSLIELLGLSRLNPLVLWMEMIEKKAFAEADAVVSTLSNAFDYMEPFGVQNERFHFIPNGFSRDDWFENESEIPEAHEREFSRCRNRNKLIVVYAGSHGPPNALDQILSLSEVVKAGDVPYHFILIGEGASKEKLIRQTKSRGIRFISFLPKVPQRAVPAILSRADVCFLGWQKKKIYHYGISPNKLCEYFMSGKPILHALDAPDDPVAKAGAGIRVEPYNPHHLNECLENFCSMHKAERESMGQKGRQYALKHLEWSVLGKKYHHLCTDLTGKN